MFFCFAASSQQMNVMNLETLLNSSAKNADVLLQKIKFKLADKKSGAGYTNYYYTSYEKKDSSHIIIRSLSFMDVYSGSDTSRLLLFRTYNKNDQEEMKKQLLINGYELNKRTDNDFHYKKENYSVVNRISEKRVPAKNTVVAYEFEMGR